MQIFTVPERAAVRASVQLAILKLKIIVPPTAQRMSRHVSASLATTTTDWSALYAAVQILMPKLPKPVTLAALQILRPALAMPTIGVTVQPALLARLALRMPLWEHLAMAPLVRIPALAHAIRDSLGTVWYALSVAVITKTLTS
jgi:hypothetical protein